MESLQLLPPDMLQLYIQQVINQTFATMAAGESGEQGEESSTETANTLQVSPTLLWRGILSFEVLCGCRF